MPKSSVFERYSTEYDAWFNENSAVYHSELEAVRLLLPPEGTGLEVGVGSGRFAAPLGIALGVEPSEAMARLARERGVAVLAGVAEALPFADTTFDLVLMVMVLCFVDDAKLALQEAHRVLKPGGCLVLAFIDRLSELGQQYQRTKNSDKYYRDATLYSTDEIIGLLQQAGFSLDSIRQTVISDAPPGTVLEGSGRGAFVVVRGIKANDRDSREQP